MGNEAKIMFKEFRDAVKLAITLAKIQSPREASHHLTLINNC